MESERFIRASREADAEGLVTECLLHQLAGVDLVPAPADLRVACIADVAVVRPHDHLAVPPAAEAAVLLQSCTESGGSLMQKRAQSFHTTSSFEVFVTVTT